MHESEHVLDWLQRWYAGQCDEDWEHSWGVKIETLDNPGWHVEIDLAETELEDLSYPRQDVTRSKNDWVWVWTAKQKFHAACGPGNLTEALTLFRDWATGQSAPA
ncbi:hypothetical protein Cs7R123_51870 [Catellatospora sp. TT07R-123]|uniref:immunity 53 family protein n=1 Tax=Catellatospora sp. TT07R-123 TaxID=2733863 RepID=UPI001B108D6D|nr:immunity 53 family protein [Catellatospora sp. TT07R-123]GHJ47845.1 hypothetical protein Cs7R123_51870 [Catellatospora sp. TT07R-123]